MSLRIAVRFSCTIVPIILYAELRVGCFQALAIICLAARNKKSTSFLLCLGKSDTGLCSNASKDKSTIRVDSSLSNLYIGASSGNEICAQGKEWGPLLKGLKQECRGQKVNKY